MTNYVPPAPGVTTPPVTCMEYLGAHLGHCDGAAQVPDDKGRAFCTDHAKERGF